MSAPHRAVTLSLRERSARPKVGAGERICRNIIAGYQPVNKGLEPLVCRGEEELDRIRCTADILVRRAR